MMWYKVSSCAVFTMRVSRILPGSRCGLRYQRAEAALKRRRVAGSSYRRTQQG
jgi:hypothetical protein